MGEKKVKKMGKIKASEVILWRIDIVGNNVEEGIGKVDELNNNVVAVMDELDKFGKVVGREYVELNNHVGVIRNALIGLLIMLGLFLMYFMYCGCFGGM